VQNPQRFSVNLEARNINVESMLTQIPFLRGRLAGTGELDLQLFGSLVSDWRRTLTGKGQFAVRNGRISGFSLAGTAQPVADESSAGRNTTFVTVTGDLDINHERFTSRAIHLQSPRGTMDLQGSYSLDGSLAYNGQLTATVQPEQSNGSITQSNERTPGAFARSIIVPFAIRGTLQDIQLIPGRRTAKAAVPTQVRAGPPFPNLFQRQLN
jgi:hypothetical protein